MLRYFITLSYNGKNYVGWQIQPNGISVQQVLQESLSIILRQEIVIVGAGRTDAGVHAREMIAHFDYPANTANLRNPDICESSSNSDKPVNADNLETPANLAMPVNVVNHETPVNLDKSVDILDCETLVRKLNRFLPKDIAISAIYPVKPDAHARFSAVARTYKYFVTTLKDPFSCDYAYRLFYQPDIETMNTLCEVLYEYEDFTSFSKLHTDVKTNNCRIKYARWEKKGDLYEFTIRADRFLRNMVRAIVGTLLEAGRGQLDEQGFRKIIEARDRNAAGDSVPGHALFLEKVDYPDDIRL